VLEANKVDKRRDRGYMDLGYSGFMNGVRTKREWIPQPRATWVFFLGKRRPSRVMMKNISICWKQRLFTITKEIKNNLG
jgi:hypothetical protein